MKRQTFLTIASMNALMVGVTATFFPSLLLISKGVFPGDEVKVWMTEVGILLIVLGVINFLIRKHPSSPTLFVLFLGNVLIQLGLLAVEVLAFAKGTITEISGIIPNSTVHVALSMGFTYYIFKMVPNKNPQGVSLKVDH
ncbi:hypothetical protein [Allomuricauda sp. M10]|uniref:hypothetical protein n=1 Tax=Allomuricauda sp. M10 TaxID=2683292 RepID=UPI001D191EAF|nr:hypothetical protein [Muricauda sp. M10]